MKFEPMVRKEKQVRQNFEKGITAKLADLDRSVAEYTAQLEGRCGVFFQLVSGGLYGFTTNKIND